MRIVLVINSLIYGGAETQVIALSRMLVARGHAVSIYTLEDNNPRLDELSESGVIVTIDKKRRKLDLGVIWRLRKHIRSFRADIVHGFLFDGNVYAGMAARSANVPVLASERSDNYSLNSNQRLSLFFLRRMVSGVVANSEAGARFARRLFRLPMQNFHVVWNGIDLRLADRSSAASNASFRQEFFGLGVYKVACLVGIVKRAKDYRLALQVGDLLTKANPIWRVLFVGGPAIAEPDYFDEIMLAWRELQLEGRVHFAGLRQDVAEIMSQCDVIFSTSLHEGFPNVVLEAMALRKPVVSTEYSDIRLILPESWQVVGSRSPVDICAAIIQAERARLTIASKQRAWVERNATMLRAVERLESAYRAYVS